VTDAHGGPFTGHDLDRLTSLVVAAWSAGRDRDWSRPAGTVAWTCTRTAAHTVDAVLAVAFFLASRRRDAYPTWGGGDLLLGPDPSPDDLVEAIATTGRVLSAVVAAAELGTRAIIWRRPVPGTGTPPDFAARGALELVLHAHDVCAGLAVPFEPPVDACARLRDHTRAWPHWSSPGWQPAPATGDPWGDLLAGAGRARVS
jgi:hypothetical protein